VTRQTSRGGHALLATKRGERMRRGLRVDLGAPFTRPTVAGLAEGVTGGLQVPVPSDAVPGPGAVAPGRLQPSHVEICP
jgi:hypothetical protein